MEILVFTLNAALIYFVSDWILRRIETARGEVMKHRQLVFFAIIMVLALVSFQLLGALFEGGKNVIN